MELELGEDMNECMGSLDFEGLFIAERKRVCFDFGGSLVLFHFFFFGLTISLFFNSNPF
jgi:hypothetical protein